MPATIPQPTELLLAYDTDADLRRRYLAVESGGEERAPRTKEDRDLLRKSAIVLELTLAGVCLCEELEALDARSIKESRESLAYFSNAVRRRSGLDLKSVMEDAQREFGDLSTSGDKNALAPQLDAVARNVASLVEACPIGYLEALGSSPTYTRDSHRCRVAYDALRAFMVRVNPGYRARMKFLGQEYMRGVLSVEQVSLLLELTIPDAIALLEEGGYRRPPETIALDDEARTTGLAKIRSERLERGGEPIFSDELVRRDVLASERIEGVDARPWLRRELK